MKRIVVIGRCQAVGIGDALLHMLDDCEVSSFFIQDTQKKAVPPSVVEALAKSDIIFSHYFHDNEGLLSTSKLREEMGNLILVPPVIFSGFHPDCLDVIWNGANCNSPLGVYHSAIVAAAYSLDIPCDRVPTLFNKLVYGRLGYFEEFAKARTYLDSSMKAHGLDIAGEWPDWVRSGSFMHTFNHPKIGVLASLAKLLAIKAGLVPAQTPTPEVTLDRLALFASWPVYPELAEGLSLKGSYTFKSDGMIDLIKGGHSLMSLREFVEGSYEIYTDIPAAAFDFPALVKTRAVLSALLAGKV